MERTASLYRWLFQLPTLKKLLIFSFAASLCIGVTVRIIIYFSMPLIFNMIIGFIQGVSALFIPIVLSTLIVSPIMKSEESVWDRRRLYALSTICMLFLGTACIVGAIASILANRTAIISVAFVFGASFIFMLRLLVIRAMSKFSTFRSSIVALTQPLFCIIAILPFQELTFSLGVVELLIMFTITSIIFGFAALVYLWLVDRPILKMLKVSGIDFLYGFLLDWIENKSYVLEEKFEKIGEEASLPVLTLLFKDSNALNSVLVVPNIHPGPFKTVGSSQMPYIIAKEIKEKTGAVVSVAHGASTHGQNLVAAKEIKKVLRTIENSLDQPNFVSKASQFVTYEEDEVKMSCQIFGDLALLIVTLSPISFDDISPELGEQVREAAISEGIRDSFLIDAHNCGGEVVTPILPNSETAKKMVHAAKMAVKEAKSKMGTEIKSYVVQSKPGEFHKWEGIGPAGVTVQVVEVEGQKAAYIVIDGNNMIPGLREKVIDSVKKVGVAEAEVLTSDTHIVNAVSLDPKGYQAVGQIGDNKKLITAIVNMTKEAISSLKPVKISYAIKEVEKIKIVGEKQMKLLTTQIVKSVSTAKKSLIILISAALLNIVLQVSLFIL
ncbi:MAG: DUF2070 family protein [Candidatus Jordarchaeaceae archaeon]